MLQPHQTRVLFLDFDGVLHAPKAIARAKPPLTPREILQGWPKTFEHLPVLQKLLEGHQEIAVVVSSSWRLFLDDDELRELLEPISSWFAESIQKGPRDVAIREWLRHQPGIDYVILDDVAKFFPGDWQRLILCNSALGLSDPTVQTKLHAWIANGHVMREP